MGEDRSLGAVARKKGYIDKQRWRQRCLKFGVFGTYCETLGEFRSLEHNLPCLKHGEHDPHFSGWL